MITQKQIDEAYRNCIWRQTVEGVDVCRGVLLPCKRAIEKGKCDTFAKLFANDETP